MKISSLGWAAGFLEGEGCFHSGQRIAIRAAQVQPDPLYLLQSILGGQVNGPYKRTNPNHRAFYDWNLNGHYAIAAMMTMYPLMSPKRQESIRSAIVKWKVAPGNPRRWLARGSCKNGHDLTGSNYVVAPSGHGRCRQCGINGRKRYYMKHADKWVGYARAARLRTKEV
jgi:hypothetical protein